MAEASRLSPLDAGFLYFERPNQLLHVGCVALLEKTIPAEDFAAALEERLAGLRRYRQRPVRPLLDVTLPTWEDDGGYSVHRHVRRVMVPPPGGEAELRRLVDTLFAAPLDAAHPLWEMYLIEGLAGGRAALLTKVHHCMVDGISGTQVLEAIADAAPGGTPPTRSATNGRPAGLLDVGRLALDTLRRALAPGGLRGRLQDLRVAAGMAVDFWRVPSSTLPFNARLSAVRRIAWSEFALDDFLAMRGSAGCKVNDVVLAVIAGGLRRWLESQRVPTDGLCVRTLVPVNVRRDDEHLALGNRVSAMIARLPVDVADPVERLRRMAAEMRALKEQGHARAAGLVLELAGAIPVPIGPLLNRILPDRHLVNTVCTNIPGPRDARSILGRRVLAVHPIVPLSMNIGAGFAIMSYAGRLSICVTTDARLVPDARAITDALEAAETELRAALAVRPAAPAAAAQRGGPRVADLMTRTVATIAPEDSLAKAWGFMRVHRIRHLPVVDDLGRLVGLLTHRDLLAASTSTMALPTEDDRIVLLAWHAVAEVMETHVSTAAPEDPAAEAGARMVRHKIGCLPVLDAGGRLVGIVTEEDFLRWATTQMALAS